MGLITRHVDEITQDVFGDYGLLNDSEPVKIRLKDGAVPYNVTTSRRVSAPMLKQVRAELERMVDNNIISPITEPTEWCVPKKDSQVRICVNLKKLNQSVKREQIILPTIEDVATKLNGSNVFTTLDACRSFWQLPLYPEDAKKTTFITPYGRYYFNSATEIYQRKMCELLDGIDGVIVAIYDILLYSRDRHTTLCLNR